MSDATVPVSVMIFTLNEEIHLSSCLDSLEGFDDIIVIDSFSVDRTKEISLQRGARFFEHAFEGFGSQRNWALDTVTTTHPWILILDADERVTKELADELRSVASADPEGFGAYRLRRRFHMWGRWLRHSSLYPSWVVRVIHRDRVRFIDRGHAETQTVDGKIGELKNDLIDQNLKGVDAWFERQSRYARKEADREIEEERETKLSLWRLLSRDPLKRREALKALGRRMPCRGVIYFVYAYILRGGFRDGRDGMVFCAMKAMYQQMIAIKKYDSRRSGKPTV